MSCYEFFLCKIFILHYSYLCSVMLRNPHHIILFDGVCNLCNTSVQFIIKRDKKGIFQFAPLQSDFARQALENIQTSGLKTESVIYISGNKLYSRSSAALRIAKKLNTPWPVLYFFIIIPPFIRNWFYDLIARNRYKWFGKKESCMIPSPELKSRFLG